MKIGIYPGSYNPIHKAHIGMAKYCLEKGLVEKIVLVPLESYWEKNVNVSLADRVNMLKLYESDNIAIEENCPGYTYQIIDKVTSDYPDAEIYYMIGADNLNNIDKWKNLDAVLKHNFIVFERDGSNVDANIEKQHLDRKKFTILENIFSMNISSTEIRERIKGGKDTSDILDEKVRAYIDKFNLYRD